MHKIKYNDVVEAARKVTRNGSSRRVNRYIKKWEDSCVYTAPNGAPHCVVGHIFDELGIPRPEPEANTNRSSLRSTKMERQLRPFFNSKDWDESYTLLIELQKQADVNVTWGEAFENVMWGRSA